MRFGNGNDTRLVLIHSRRALYIIPVANREVNRKGALKLGNYNDLRWLYRIIHAPYSKS